MRRATWTAAAGCLLAVLLGGCATVVTGKASAAGTASSATAASSSPSAGSATPPGGAVGSRAQTATAAPPASPSATHGPSGLLEFTTPSRNIACIVGSGTPGDASDPGQARCDITQATWDPPAQPASCAGDWGHALTVGPDGSGFACVSDSAVNDDVVDYGTTQVRGAFSCAVDQSGVTCTDLDTGHGFAVSSERYQLF